MAHDTNIHNVMCHDVTQCSNTIAFASFLVFLRIVIVVSFKIEKKMLFCILESAMEINVIVFSWPVKLNRWSLHLSLMICVSFPPSLPCFSQHMPSLYRRVGCKPNELTPSVHWLVIHLHEIVLCHFPEFSHRASSNAYF